MRPQTLWPNDPVFIEIGIRDADLALGLRREGFAKYLGVCGDAVRIARLQTEHPELADQLTNSTRRKLVLNNNAEVLILSGRKAAHLWSYHSVRHARWVAWRAGFGAFSWVALLGCLFHLINRRYSWPQLVTLRQPNGKATRLFVSRVLRRKPCRRKSLHFIPHRPGLTGFFKALDARGVRYAVLRWFDSLPEIEPREDVDMLVADDSLAALIEVLESLPGILPCDVYSESGLARSEYCSMPYYPAHVARRILDGAVLHKNLCRVPNPWDYFHSLAYHAVYHKATRSNLARGETGLSTDAKSSHDFQVILREMADRLGIRCEISLEGLHAYLQETSWGPSPEMLARLAVACSRDKWLAMLAKRVPPHVSDQGLAVFVLRQEAVERGFQDEVIRMIEKFGFEIIGTRTLRPHEVEHAAARCRGGNWEEDGPFEASGGLPATTVVAYDRNPLPPNRRQLRRFPRRTNARLFVKEKIRDAIAAQLPADQTFNALHSSDHAAEAWHLIEVLAPELIPATRARIQAIHKAAQAPRPAARQAA